ncbi:MAG: archease [Lentisphaerae bacterium]|nr:archease [Lentisphaerota bacterium]
MCEGDSSRRPPWLAYLEHTADAGIEVRAASAAELYARAAWGMFSLLTDPARVRPAESWPVRVTAPDRETLMVRWLSALNVRHQTERRLFGAFEVQECSATELRATVRGEPFDPARHGLHGEIKAVTYHMLAVAETEGGWLARVLFDV